MDLGGVCYWMMLTLPAVQAYLTFVEGREMRIL